MKPIFRTLVWLDSTKLPELNAQILITMYYDGWNYAVKIFVDKPSENLAPWEINKEMIQHCYWAYLDEVDPPFDIETCKNIVSP